MTKTWITTTRAWRSQLALATLVVSTLLVAPHTAQAEVTLGPHLGINFDWDEVFIGGELRADMVNLSPNVKLQLDPSLSIAFFGHGTALDFSFNTPFVFTIADSVLKPYAAPGLALVHYGGDFGSDTELYLNLIGGLLFDLNGFDPFVQLKVMVPHGSMAELMGGVLFEL